MLPSNDSRIFYPIWRYWMIQNITVDDLNKLHGWEMEIGRSHIFCEIAHNFKIKYPEPFRVTKDSTTEAHKWFFSHKPSLKDLPPDTEERIDNLDYLHAWDNKLKSAYIHTIDFESPKKSKYEKVLSGED